MSQKGLRVEFSVPRPRKRQEETPAPKDPVPRIARLLALAHKWEGMVRRGEVEDYAEIARTSDLSPARVTQICNLVLLATDLQTEILHAPAPFQAERRLRPVVALPAWRQQRDLWLTAT